MKPRLRSHAILVPGLLGALCGAGAVGCGGDEGEGAAVFGACTTDAECPTGTRCVEGILGGLMCTLECSSGPDCAAVPSSDALWCVERGTGEPSICVPSCPDPTSTDPSINRGCLPAYDIGSVGRPGEVPECVCTR